MAHFAGILRDGRKCSHGSKGAYSPGKITPGRSPQTRCGSEKWKLRSTFHHKGCTTCNMVGFKTESSLGVMDFLGVRGALLYTDSGPFPIHLMLYLFGFVLWFSIQKHFVRGSPN